MLVLIFIYLFLGCVFVVEEVVFNLVFISTIDSRNSFLVLYIWYLGSKPKVYEPGFNDKTYVTIHAYIVMIIVTWDEIYIGLLCWSDLKWPSCIVYMFVYFISVIAYHQHVYYTDRISSLRQSCRITWNHTRIFF